MRVRPLPRYLVMAGLAFATLTPTADAQELPTILGDFDADGTPTVADLVRLINHLKGDPVLPAELAPFSDIDQNGTVDVADIERLTSVILEREPQTVLPIASIDHFSPSDGEGNVAVTREVIMRFSAPLAADAVINVDNFYAQYAGQRLLGRVEISSDRLKATLFHQQNLPSSARIRVTFNPDGVNDYLGREVDADGDGKMGGTAAIDFDTLSITPVPGTGVIGTIYAAEKDEANNNVPLAGVIIEVVGAEDHTRTTTAADGTFSLSPVPAGEFFVNVDGRLVTGGFPDAGYYPFVRKVWRAEPARSDNLAAGSGEIFLPFICPGTLQTVSPIEITPVRLPQEIIDANPEFTGVSVTVPANSLFGDDGSRGGKVGLAPVAADRLPEPLPNGLELPLVITVQTDGASNFDRPATVRFPNTPDPATGERLPAGSKSALWSFNHDVGDWELQGPMTVSADGIWVVSDPGVGIRQPGWHGQAPCSRLSVPAPPPRGAGGGRRCANNPRENNERRAECVANGVSGVATGIVAGIAWEFVPTPVPIPGVTGAVVEYIVADEACGAVLDAAGIDPIASGQASGDCQQFYLDCNLDPYGLERGGLGRRGVRRRTSTEIDTLLNSALATIDSVLADREDMGTIYGMGETVIGDTELEDLTPEQLQLLRDLDDALADFLDEKSVEEFFAPRLKELEQFYDAIRQEFDFNRTKRGYFAIEDIETGAIIRGRTNSQGAVDGICVRPNAAYQTNLFFPSESGPSPDGAGSSGDVFVGLSATGDIGEERRAPPGVLADPTPDSDSDGLEDAAEFIIGTLPNNPDSDGDGIRDGAEIDQGTDPLDGLPVATGVIASGPTAAAALDICAVNDRLAVACGLEGVTIYDASAGFNPVRVAQVDTPGSAEAVACFGNLVAVADGSGGLTIIDTTDPPASEIIRQLPFASAAKAVTVHGNIVFVGLASGAIAVVDLPTGTLLSLNLQIEAPIQDLALAGDYLYALEVGQLHVFEILAGEIARVSSEALPDAQGSSLRNLRLFVGDRFALASHKIGYNELDITNPAQPVHRQQIDTAQFGWKQIVANGSGLAIAAVGNNSGNDGPHHIDLYNIGADGADGVFITTIQTPGIASAVALYNGFAYIADGSAGLQIVNYLAFDTLGQAPTAALSTNAVAGEFEEGKVMRVTAAVTDDVQVRNVQFFIDGALALTDGNFPFEMRFVTPLLEDGISSFTLKTIATDTGGNTAESAELTFNLVPDATPPRVWRTLPSNGGIVGQLRAVTVFMSEAIDTDTITGGSFLVTRGVGSTDGATTPQIDSIDFRDTLNALVINFEDPLEPGTYQITVRDPLADLAGIPIAPSFRSTFRVYGFADADLDGVPDNVEGALGLDPLNPDSDGDGIPDGAEDFDGDGLANAGEFPVGADPTIADTDGDGTLDGAEDTDGDALNDQQEFVQGTDPNESDSDGDGWSDEAEVTGVGDPLNPLSAPVPFVSSTQALRGHRTAPDPVEVGDFILGKPSTRARRTAPDPVQVGDFHLGKPRILIERP